jgi:hypothetical protein
LDLVVRAAPKAPGSEKPMKQCNWMAKGFEPVDQFSPISDTKRLLIGLQIEDRGVDLKTIKTRLNKRGVSNYSNLGPVRQGRSAKFFSQLASSLLGWLAKAISPDRGDGLVR